ncbi:MAG: DUF1329 domain-containing protein [Deltaproteobacteria bacterium]|nr:DUF1329 domain-containing protein [Deltaproteobacteria bacterium]
MSFRSALGLIAAALLATGGAAIAADDGAARDAVDRSFFPYNGADKRADLPPVISAANWQAAGELLPAELAERVKNGDLEVRTRPTTDLPPSPAYIEATRRHSGHCRLREDGGLEGYVSGRPFPEIDAADPQAGAKLAWNFRYPDANDSAQAWGVFRILDAGRMIREIEYYYVLAYGMHREDTRADRWGPDGILYKEFYQALAPFDVQNLMRIRFRHDDDHGTDVEFAYSPETRKVRRLQTTMEEAVMGSELLNEDFFGFSGYVRAHQWRFLGRKTVLAPLGLQAARVTFAANTAYPTDAWEPRRMLLLEATPKNSAHPYAKRVLYVDEQQGVAPYVLVYDKQGRHYKTIFTYYGNPAYNPGNERLRRPLWIGDSVVNHTSGQSALNALNRIVTESRVSDELFSVDQLVERGR